MGVEQTVKEFMEKNPAKSVSYQDKAAIAEQLALKPATVGWALWNLARKGIIVKAAGRGTLAEEAPEAYKDVSLVVETAHQTGISRKVARLKPLGVVKG